MRDNSDNYKEILLSGVPLLDVRAPIEFNKGAFPNTINLPLMNDVERQKVGACYKNSGQDAAIALGHQLVSGSLKEARIQAWREFALANPQGYLYCFRGGLRSKLSQQWLEQIGGVPYPRIVGGYKAMRTFLLGTLQSAVNECPLTVVGGLTGIGKTEVLVELESLKLPELGTLDLEQHANHRGSSFGKHATSQPAQIDFENTIAIDILRQREQGRRRFVLEDEGRIVGSCSVPFELHSAMQTCDLVWLEDSLENRVERILKDYVIDLCAEFVSIHGSETGFTAFSVRLRDSLDRIIKRLGHERHQRLAALMDAALTEQRLDNDTGMELHRQWIYALLTEYYDPMYAFQREKKADRIIFSGDRDAVIDFLRSR